MITAVDVILQFGVLMFGALATYYWQWTKGGVYVQTFAFPMTCVGTVILYAGLSLCVHYIDASIKEKIYDTSLNPPPGSLTDQPGSESARPEDLRIVWLQRDQQIGEVHFKPLAIFGNKESDSLRMVRTSHRIEPESVADQKKVDAYRNDFKNVGVGFVVVGT
jgi:hypothetical protein